MEVLAKPWNGQIMAMLADGPLRFSEIGDRLDTIGDRMLAERLRELEARGLLVRRVEDGPPVRVHYELSKSGHAFSKVAEAISVWGAQLHDEPLATRVGKRTVPRVAAAKPKGAKRRRA